MGQVLVDDFMTGKALLGAGLAVWDRVGGMPIWCTKWQEVQVTPSL